MKNSKIAALYARLLRDDEQQGESNRVRATASRTNTGFVKDIFTYKFNEVAF